MVVEMQVMKERMDFKMNALRGQVSNDLDELVHRTDSPFIAPVTLFPFPPKSCKPQIEAYNGSKDPLNHLESFKTLMHLQGVANEISNFKELNAQFTSHFIGRHRYKKSTICLMNIKQLKDETLRSYITRFNKEAVLIDEANDKILVVAFTNGLRKGNFLFSLYKNEPKTMSDVLYRATKYMNAKDVLLAQEEKPRKRERQEDARQDKGWKTTKTEDQREDRHSKPPLEGSQASSC